MMNKLLEIKKELLLDDSLYIETTNKKTGWIGVASFFTNGENKIRVNEGNPDGSDDDDYTYEEFLNNYKFEILHEEVFDDE